MSSPTSASSRDGLSISAVERDTGLSKETLRVWERRYGFPQPQRDAWGERSYAPAQVEKLRCVKRLLDAGHRPGRLVPLSLNELQRLSEAMELGRGVDASGFDSAGPLDWIRSHDSAVLRHGLTRLQLNLGLARFVIEVIAPLNMAVGDAWLRGQLEVFEEHLYTEAVQVVLRQAIAGLPPQPAGAGHPRVLLTTLPSEPHGLGLLMAEALLTLQGCDCISLGVQTPLWDVVLAANACRADIVALSFTGCMNPNQVVDALGELRAKLPVTTTVWAGGSAPVLHRRRVPGVAALGSLGQIEDALQEWHASAASGQAYHDD